MSGNGTIPAGQDYSTDICPSDIANVKAYVGDTQIFPDDVTELPNGCYQLKFSGSDIEPAEAIFKILENSTVLEEKKIV